jgi:hypothetical protein
MPIRIKLVVFLATLECLPEQENPLGIASLTMDLTDRRRAIEAEAFSL